MSAGGTGGVGGRREKTTALADECDSRCGACAATLTDEELEGGTGGTGSLSAHTGGPISSHSRASLCTRFAICLAPKSTPRRSRNRPAGGFWVWQLLAAHRKSVRWSVSLHYRIASLQGWIDVEPAVPCKDRPRAAVWCNRAALATGWHVRSPGQRGVPRGDQGRLIQINNRGGLSL
jgi:hypothetical protein